MNKSCPVCKAELQRLRCDKCGFGMAGVDLFSSAKAYEVWKKAAEEYKSSFEPCTREELVGTFSICRNCAAVFDRKKGRVTFFHSNGQNEVIENAADVSLGDTHRVVVLKDGTVRAYGENRFGQCSVDAITDAVSACTGDNQTYVVEKNGKLSFAGSIDMNISEKLKNASNTVSAVAGQYNCALLDDSGDVTFIGSFNASQALRDRALRSQDISIMRSCLDAVVCVGKDGSVYYSGGKDGRLKAGSWKDIIDIAVDSHCVVGLTKDGKLRIAYRNSNSTRFEALERVGEASAVASGSSCIAVITVNGDLIIAGNIQRSENIVNSFYANADTRKMFILKR